MQIKFELIKRKAWEHAKSQTLHGLSFRKSKVRVYVRGRKRILSSSKKFALLEMTSSVIFVRTAGHQNCKDSPHKISFDELSSVVLRTSFYMVQQKAKQQLTLLDM